MFPYQKAAGTMAGGRGMSLKGVVLDIENKCMDTKGEKGWDELGDWDWPIHTMDTMYKTDN